MGADDGDVGADELVDHRVLVDPLEGVEDDRVMADNKLAVDFDSLPHDGGGDVQRGQHTVHGLTRIDEQADVEEKVIQKSAYGALYAAIDRLPGKYREVIIFREINNLSYEEISKILSLPQGTVKSRIKRGREALKNLLLENKELFVK